MTPFLAALCLTLGSPPTVPVTVFPLKAMKEVLSIPPNVTVKNNIFSDEMQWDALAKCVRIEGTDSVIGSAVVVGMNEGSIYFLTANHNISGLELRKLEFFSKKSYRDADQLKKNTFKGALVALRNPNTDLALLKVKIEHLTPEIAVLPKPYDRPKHFPFQALSIGCSEGRSPTCQIEEVLGRPLVRRTNEFGSFFWESKTQSYEGRSGGPLFDAKGRLIGICAGKQGNRSYFTHLDEIHAWLKENQYGWIWERKVRP